VCAKIGIEVKFSLRTANPAVAELREVVAREQLIRRFHTVENGPSPVSHRQLVALAGQVYRLYAEELAEDPGSADRWIAFKGINRAVKEGRISGAPPIRPGEANDEEIAKHLFGEDLTSGINALPPGPAENVIEQRFGLLANWVLAQNGLELAADDRSRLLQKIPQAADPPRCQRPKIRRWIARAIAVRYYSNASRGGGGMRLYRGIKVPALSERLIGRDLEVDSW
jgi:hypothetical protein